MFLCRWQTTCIFHQYYTATYPACIIFNCPSSSAIARTSTKLKLKFDMLFHQTFPTKFMVTLHVCRWGTSIDTMEATQCLYQYTCFWSSANSMANFLFFLLLSLSFLFKSPVTVFSSFKSCIAYIHNTKLHGFTYALLLNTVQTRCSIHMYIHCILLQIHVNSIHVSAVTPNWDIIYSYCMYRKGAHWIHHVLKQGAWA